MVRPRAVPSAGNQPLEVTWVATSPPIEPQRWQVWEELSRPDATDFRLEQELNWPHGTLAVLRDAFRRKLPRTTGWEASAALVASELDVIASAAAAFRRGVGWQDARGVQRRTRQGAYSINFYEASQDIGSFISRCPDVASSQYGAGSIFAVIDGHVARLWPDITRSFPQHCTTILDEHSKTLTSVGAILASWRAQGAAQRWVIVGGGLLTDVAAYAAHLQGVEFSFIPTTLLAMADACIGGKTGVNFPPFGKNQVGAFAFPSAVHVWSGWLQTLSTRELAAGGAECLKHAFLIGDLQLAERIARALSSRDLKALAETLPCIISVKANIVHEDPTEAGQRAILNFGHTLAHALEAVSHARTQGISTILHGEAVGIGMIFALRLSERITRLKQNSADAMTTLLQMSGCSLKASTLAEHLGVENLRNPALFTQLHSYLIQDKKQVQQPDTLAQDPDSTEWILLEAPGSVAKGADGGWTTRVSYQNVEETWQEFIDNL